MDIKERVARIIGDDYDANRDWCEYLPGVQEMFYKMADQIIPLVRADTQREIGDWLKGTCQCRVPFHARWHCAICKNRLLVALKSGTFKEIEEIG